jgi:hypothetical protein
MRRLLIGCLLVLVVSFTCAALVLADSGEVALEQQPPLPVGTVITTQNWQQYKDYMPFWMQIFFSGQYAYKLAPDQQVVVGPPTIRPFPQEYEKNTEKYGGQTDLKMLPNGGTVLQNYTAGIPFPHPTNPNIGDKIIWNLWFHYFPRVEAEAPLYIFLIDKYHQVYQQNVLVDYMQLGHVSDPGQPIYTPQAKGIDQAQYVEVLEPEQSKYTVSLVLFFTDTTRVQENWSFVPSLRRPLRLSAAARCAPALGTDVTYEDARTGFSMMPSDTTVTLVAHKMMLMMNGLQPAYPAAIDFTDANTSLVWELKKGIPWPPAPSKWDLGETWVVDAKRVPDKLVGYCYGNRRIYLDAQHYRLSGEDLYDMGGKLWKTAFMFSRLHPDGYGGMYDTGEGDLIFTMIDFQNLHESVNDHFVLGADRTNTQVDPAYWSVTRYASPSGLLEIMK